MDGPPSGRDARAEAVADRACADALQRLARHEFSTFLCGCRLPRDLADDPRDEQEAFRRAVGARLTERLSAAWPGRTVDRLAPEVVVEARPEDGSAKILVVPLFVAGRYRKLVRGLSQTVFLCRACRGRRRGAGCAACGGTGRAVAEAVEDFVLPVVARRVGGRPGAFHGSGREDVDVRMLGTGRAFVVSVLRPVLRSFDAEALAAAVSAASSGRVEVADLRAVSRAEMSRITMDHGEKTYRVTVQAVGAGELPPDAAARLAALRGAEILQRTPHRVGGRRADLVRTRRVLGVEVMGEDGGAAGRDDALPGVPSGERPEPQRLELVVRTDPGTYVKELVSGDDGRTHPSLASLLGVACVCAELDVLATS